MDKTKQNWAEAQKDFVANLRESICSNTRDLSGFPRRKATELLPKGAKWNATQTKTGLRQRVV
ncbi:hypothetical protein LTR81_026761 [Elasticomyces elasticus]